jgi:hypothetical protein
VKEPMKTTLTRVLGKVKGYCLILTKEVRVMEFEQIIGQLHQLIDKNLLTEDELRELAMLSYSLSMECNNKIHNIKH